MAITVSFSTGSKRENSTKQLTMTVTHDCVFKNGCSMLNPTLLLEINTGVFPDYTAFKIENRYYNVTDIRSVRDNLFEISGEIDVLATYKTNILATTAYVIYDSTSNSEIPDNRLPMKTTASHTAQTAACPLVPDSGCYILSLTGSHGTTGVYKVSLSELSDLIDDLEDIIDDLFDFSSWDPPESPDEPSESTVENWLSFIGDCVKYVGEWILYAIQCAIHPISQFFGSKDVPSNIRQCIYIPFNRGTTHGANKVYLGTFETSQSLGKLNTDTIVDSADVAIPWAANDYRRRSPYTSLYLYMPYIGVVQLSPENLIGKTTLNVQYALCMRNGDLIVTVRAGNDIIGQYPGNVGVSVPVGFSNMDRVKGVQSLIASVAAMASGNLGTAGMAALSFKDALTPTYSSIGGLDGIAGIATRQTITCYCVFHDTIAPPNTELATVGSPTMYPKPLTGLTGFVQTLAASVEGAMTQEERDKLNTLLDNGIFIE